MGSRQAMQRVANGRGREPRMLEWYTDIADET